MIAAQINDYGSPDDIEIVNVDKPTLKEDQVLVQVQAAALNPFDDKMLTGKSKLPPTLSFPVTLGGDFAGVVSELAPGVTEFKIGAEVYGQALVFNGGSGTLAEYAAANIKNTAPKPQSLSMLEAATLPLVGSSAIQALTEHMTLKPGQTILIHGGAGGIGSLAVQYAKSLDLQVITTASGEDIDYVKSLGADQAIDYKTTKFEDVVKDVDAVFDTVSGDTYTHSYQVIKPGGVIVSMISKPDETLMAKYQVQAFAQSSHVTPERLAQLAQLVDAGTIKPQIDKEFSLDQAAEAFRFFEQGHHRGKVVLSIS